MKSQVCFSCDRVRQLLCVAMICFGSFRQTLIWRTGSKVVLEEDNHNEWFVVPPAIHNWNVAGSVYSFKDITFIFAQFREFNLCTTAKIHTLFYGVKTMYTELHQKHITYLGDMLLATLIESLYDSSESLLRKIFFKIPQTSKSEQVYWSHCAHDLHRNA